MRYTPRTITAETMLLCAGFTPANRGYELRRKIPSPNPKKVDRLHALIIFPDLDIEVHEDYPTESDTRHTSKKNSPRLRELKNLFEMWDGNKEITQEQVNGFVRRYGAVIPRI